MTHFTSTDVDRWLSQCSEDKKQMPAFERHIYLLDDVVVKKRLEEGEKGYRGFEPEFDTLEKRDENEILAMEQVKKYTDIPVPDLLYRGEGYNVFRRIPGKTLYHPDHWEALHLNQRASIRLQVQSLIRKLWCIPTPITGQYSVRSLVPSGEIFRKRQLNDVGPFPSTATFMAANSGKPGIDEINPLSIPVFSHLDWDLSNIILAPNMDTVVGVVDWERACWFPEAGKSMHAVANHWEGWETLFDGLEFPVR
ncbi:hypothetical protein EDC01DRAFT_730723 [Geopyxis carbonaria]|nr:hypothetical protein EDC01DRAFT_730723 [Geopyxis carbonaria]